MENPILLNNQHTSSSTTANTSRKKSPQMKKSCELCESLATIYCESDQAILFWNCDSKIHRANFLVAKHTRVLLSHFCQSLTPWTGSGPKLTATITSCELCDHQNGHSETPTEEEDQEDNEEDDEENQVVPGASSSFSSNPYPQVSGYTSTSDQEWSCRLYDYYQAASLSGGGFH